MANYIVSYDLNGPQPSHAQMDKHLERVGAARGRILETVWYVGYPGNMQDLFDHVKAILGSEDRLVVVEAREAAFINLLVNDQSLVNTWTGNR